MDAPFLNQYGHVAAPVAYHNGRLVGFESTNAKRPRHWFGGPRPPIINAPTNAAIQLVLSLNLNCLRVSAPCTRVPFLYPFQHDGGKLVYKCTPDGHAVLESIQPTMPTLDWPYADYPSEFGKRSLRGSRARSISHDCFEEDYAQASVSPRHIVVLVPASSAYGVSLWGPHGDSAGVVCVFHVNPAKWRISAFNVCD